MSEPAGPHEGRPATLGGLRAALAALEGMSEVEQIKALPDLIAAAPVVLAGYRSSLVRGLTEGPLGTSYARLGRELGMSRQQVARIAGTAPPAGSLPIIHIVRSDVWYGRTPHWPLWHHLTGAHIGSDLRKHPLPGLAPPLGR